MFVFGSSALRFLWCEVEPGERLFSLSSCADFLPAFYPEVPKLAGSGSPHCGTWVSPAPARLALRSATSGVEVGAADPTWISGGEVSYLTISGEPLGGFLALLRIEVLSLGSISLSLGPPS